MSRIGSQTGSQTGSKTGSQTGSKFGSRSGIDVSSNTKSKLVTEINKVGSRNGLNNKTLDGLNRGTHTSMVGLNRGTYTSMDGLNRGTFFSPSFPQNYPSNSRCSFTFLGTGGERVGVMFKAVQLEPTDLR